MRAILQRALSSLSALRAGADYADSLGLEVHAGHGLTYDYGGTDCRDKADPRVEYRPFPDCRGDLFRARPRDHAYAQADGRGAGMSRTRFLYLRFGWHWFMTSV